MQLNAASSPPRHKYKCINYMQISIQGHEKKGSLSSWPVSDKRSPFSTMVTYLPTYNLNSACFCILFSLPGSHIYKYISVIQLRCLATKPHLPRSESKWHIHICEIHTIQLASSILQNVHKMYSNSSHSTIIRRPFSCCEWTALVSLRVL